MSYSINGVEGPAVVTSSSYVPVATFSYRGAINEPAISQIVSVVDTSDTVATGQVRVRDVTNNQTIAESAVFGPYNGVKTMVDLGTISNIPGNAAIMEVQLRRDTGTLVLNSARMYSLQVYE